MNIELLYYARPLVKRFWNICLLRLGPEDVPASPLLFITLLPLGFLIDSIRLNLMLPDIPAYQILITLLIYTLLMLSAVAGLVWLLGYPQRILQTLIAMSGTGILISVLVLPFDYIISLNPERFTMATLILLLAQLWSLLIMGHILSRALSAHRLMGVIIAFGYLMFGAGVFDYLLPRSI